MHQVKISLQLYTQLCIHHQVVQRVCLTDSKQQAFLNHTTMSPHLLHNLQKYTLSFRLQDILSSGKISCAMNYPPISPIL